MSIKSYPLFSVTGIEIEYMLVDRETLNIRPIADKLLQVLSGAGVVQADLEFGNIGISNELALHVIELKTIAPVPDLFLLEQEFVAVQKKLNAVLQADFNAFLLPTGAHPWLVPDKNVALWPHGSSEIYEAFDRIFGCAGHGWVNLQSAHINLPFSNDNEFESLHNAIRLLMPIIPALTASTPFIEGQLTGHCDSRLIYYGQNQKILPLISGQVIPEHIATAAEYHEKILHPIYQALSPHDPECLLQEEWVNSRGAIARFDRSAIEIRVVDTQESLRQDLACVSAIVSALRYIVGNTHLFLEKPLDLLTLRSIYDDTILHGMNSRVLPAAYLAQFGFPSGLGVVELWERILQESPAPLPMQYETAITHILEHGNLAQRMLAFHGTNVSLPDLYQQLASATQSNEAFYV